MGIACTVYCIWKHRNAKMFEGKISHPTSIIRDIKMQSYRSLHVFFPNFKDLWRSQTGRLGWYARDLALICWLMLCSVFWGCPPEASLDQRSSYLSTGREPVSKLWPFSHGIMLLGLVWVVLCSPLLLFYSCWVSPLSGLSVKKSVVIPPLSPP